MGFSTNKIMAVMAVDITGSFIRMFTIYFLMVVAYDVYKSLTWVLCVSGSRSSSTILFILSENNKTRLPLK